MDHISRRAGADERGIGQIEPELAGRRNPAADYTFCDGSGFGHRVLDTADCPLLHGANLCGAGPGATIAAKILGRPAGLLTRNRGRFVDPFHADGGRDYLQPANHHRAGQLAPGLFYSGRIDGVAFAGLVDAGAGQAFDSGEPGSGWSVATPVGQRWLGSCPGAASLPARLAAGRGDAVPVRIVDDGAYISADDSGGRAGHRDFVRRDPVRIPLLRPDSGWILRQQSLQEYYQPADDGAAAGDGQHRVHLRGVARRQHGHGRPRANRSGVGVGVRIRDGSAALRVQQHQRAGGIGAGRTGADARGGWVWSRADARWFGGTNNGLVADRRVQRGGANGFSNCCGGVLPPNPGRSWPALPYLDVRCVIVPC